METDEKSVKRLSKFLSLVLRHDPDKIGIELDDAGWTNAADLLEAMRQHGQKITRDILDHVVLTNDKQRFSSSDDGLSIRAR